jgi:hypothetical protein
MPDWRGVSTRTREAGTSVTVGEHTKVNCRFGTRLTCSLLVGRPVQNPRDEGRRLFKIIFDQVV